MSSDRVMQAFGLLMSRDYAGAEKAFTKLLKKEPGDAELYSNRALARSGLGRANDAVADVRQALALTTDARKQKELKDHLASLEAEAKLMGNAPPEPYETALFRAAAAGDLAKVRKLIKEGADLERGKDARASNRSPLAIAAESGHLAIVRALVEAGAQLDAKVDTNLWDGPRHWTPLLLAANEGHRAIVELLVKSGADLSFVDEVGWGVVRAALKDADEDGWKKAEVLGRWLIEQGAPVTPSAQKQLAAIEEHEAASPRGAKKRG